MKCQVCGEESGKYVLCRKCNRLKEQGLVIKCEKCGRWHHKDFDCQKSEEEPRAEAAAAEPAVQEAPVQTPPESGEPFLYEPKKTLVTETEQKFYRALEETVPEGFRVFPQINLAAFLERTDGARFQNELYRNVDFLITEADYRPRVAVEINDRTHLEKRRRERDEKVQNILEEAGIPLVTLWVSDGAEPEVIGKKIREALTNPVVRVHHAHEKEAAEPPATPEKKKGCYVATCVYGSYDCGPVWVLRRFRDQTLAASRWGRAFIRTYYAVSPTLVRWFGRTEWFRSLCKPGLDRLVSRLQAKGFADTPYQD